MATPITFTKKLTLVWNSEATSAEFVAARADKINQMIDENKTDGEWEKSAEAIADPSLHGGSRKFVDQAAAEEFRTFILAERAKLGHVPIKAEITDL